MTDKQTAWCIGRILVGFGVSPLVVAICYTLFAFGLKMFFPFVFFVVGTAFSLAFLFFMPMYLILLSKRWISLLSIIATVFVSCFVLFSVVFYFNDQGFTAMGASGEVFVENGRLTFAGYVNIFRGALTVAISGTVGAVVFWLVAHSPLFNREQ